MKGCVGGIDCLDNPYFYGANMKETLPDTEFLRSDPAQDQPESGLSPGELLAPQQIPPKRWARTRIQAMRRRVERVRRQHRSLLAYIVALSFVQWIARVLVIGVGHKNLRAFDPYLIEPKWRSPSWQPPTFEYADQPAILYALLTLLLAAMAAAVVAWGVSSARAIDTLREDSPNIRLPRGRRR